jgi:uncharacterized protein YndB with AHSA1/START domain
MNLAESSETLRFSLRLAAPPAHVFALWTEPAAIKRWFGGFETEVEWVGIDLRVGGVYRIVVLDEAGPSSVTGEFLVVEPPTRLRYTWILERGGERAPATVVTVAFSASGDGTALELEHGPFVDEPIRQLHAAGWQACFQALQSLTA